jgi:putative transposase
MARKLRSECITAGQPNHIVARGNNRRRLFSYPRDYQAFLRILYVKLEATACRLHVICLMGNHVHLLVTPPTVEAMSRCMKAALQRYAQLRNGERKASGKLFEQRYESVPVTSERHLAAAQMYIEANPLRAGITADPLAYPWSSYAFYAGHPAASKVPPTWLTPTSWYQSLAATEAGRAEAYRKGFAEYVERNERPAYADRLDAFEAASAPYTLRLRRPDGSSAREPDEVLPLWPKTSCRSAGWVGGE